MNVLENIAVPLGYAGMSKKNRTARAQELLDEFHMKGLEKKVSGAVVWWRTTESFYYACNFQ